MSRAILQRYQGTGSSQVVPTRTENALDELARLGGDMQITYAAGYGSADEADPVYLDKAKAAAQQAEVAILFVGLPAAYESEGWDRQHIDLPPAHNALVDAVLSVQPNTVVVLINGSAVAMPWASRVPAILEGWLTGQAGGGALADGLLGIVNPSGKLSESFTVRLADTPAYLEFPAPGRRAAYGEGRFIGYRWVDARQVEPLFPFGHGLSYTSFAYGDLRVDTARWAEAETVSVSLTVQNTGARAGQEIVQVYIGDRTPGRREPDKGLRAFAKVALQPGEAQTVRFVLAGRDFAVYDELRGAWAIPGGDYEILVGASSRDLRLQQRVQLAATQMLQTVLDRYTTIRQWIKHPIGEATLRPLLDAQLRLRTGGASVDEVTARMVEGFVLDMPLMKLVTRGVLQRETVDQLIAFVTE